jgi:ADP-ribose pyrophosphatase YjhB (NUDIX family)
MRALIQIAYAVRRRLLGLFRVRTRGVKVMLFNADGELLLIRNSYGDRSLFLLPGGGIGRKEEPEAAAAREIREELNIDARDLTLVATYESNAEGKRDTIHLFKATAHGAATPDHTEIEEARFFPVHALPEKVSPATRRRIAEIRGERPIEGRW